MRDRYSQNIAIASGHFEHEKAYWLEKLSSEMNIGQFPLDFPSARDHQQVMAVQEFTFPVDVYARLMKLSNQSAYGVFLILLTGVNYLLARYSGNPDCIIGMPILKDQFQQGALNHLLALRSHVNTQSTCKEFLLEMKQTVSEASKHQNYPLEEIVRLLEVPTEEEYFPLSNVMMVLENIQNPQYLAGVRYDLLFAFRLADGALNGRLHFDQGRLRWETIEQVVRHLIEYFAQMTVHLDRPLKEIEILSVEERNWLLWECNATEAEFPQKCIHLLFEEQVEKTPDKRAVVDSHHSLTFRELNEQANLLAWFLREKGVQVDERVGILIGQRAEMFVGILGVLKAGGAYLPIDPQYPGERIAFMLQDSGARILLTETGLVEKVSADVEIIVLDDKAEEFGSPADGTTLQRKDHLASVNGVHDLAYVIYTSGSTGQPKGTLIEHQSLVNFVSWFQREYQLTPMDRTCKYSGFSFDASVIDIFPCLTAGGEVHLIPDEMRLNLPQLNEYFEEQQISIAFLPTQMAELFLTLENHSLRYLLTGGDKLNTFIPTSYTFINAYGPTECTVCTTTFEVNESDTNIPIGKPLDNMQVYILAPDHQLQPVGAYGEICISGAGLARGYLNREEFNREKFVVNPFRPGERMYRTGDLGRWRHDGNIEFVGRRDQQVKIRGFRIELGEIEHLLLQHSAVREAVVITRPDQDGLQQMIAYVVLRSEVTFDTLRGYLGEKLPEYMVPAYFVELSELPLTPNGKVDRRGLSEMEPDGEKRYVAPRDAAEETLARIWAEALGVEQIGITDHFLELGGHSLKAVQMVTRIKKELDADISVFDLFKHPTIAELVEVIHRGRVEGFQAIDVLPEQEYYELSYAQRRMWILDQLQPGNPAYNLMGIHYLPTELHLDPLRQACATLIQRHETLRTTFVAVEGEPRQKIHSEMPVDLAYVDLRSLAGEEAIRAQIWEEALQPFDLVQGPLLRVRLFRIADRQQILLLTMHHIISDGWSMDIFRDELTALYQAYVQMQEPILPPLPIQYKDFAHWQNQRIISGTLDTDREFWHQILQGELPAVNLPYDYPYRGLAADRQGESYRFYLPQETKDRLGEMARGEGASLFMLLLAGFTAFLARLTGGRDMMVAGPVAGREHEQLNDLIGFFLNTVVYRQQVNPAEPFRKLLHQVRDQALQVMEHQTYPFELLADELRISTDLDQPGIMSIFFNMLNFAGSGQGMISNFTPTYSFSGSMMKYDFGCYIREYANGIELDCHYRTGLFKRSTIEYLMGQYLQLLEEIARHPEVRIREIGILQRPIVTCTSHPQCRERRVEEVPWNVSKGTIVQRFEAIAEHHPEKQAVKTQECSMTYQELNQRANQVATAILETVQTGKTVALLFEQGVDQVAGLLGALKAGMIYVPLDPTYPEDRLTLMLEDSEAMLMVTNQRHQALAERLIKRRQQTFRIINLDTIPSTMAVKNLQLPLRPETPAYILYTSGSTGRPKGVLQCHRNVLHFIRVYTRNLGITADDRLTLFSSYGFDAAVMDLFGALLNGATLYPYNIKATGSLERLPGWMRGEGITIYHSIPTVFRYFVQGLTGDEAFSTLRMIVLGGEAVLKRDVDAYRRHFSDQVILVNGLGPTESTVTLQYFIDHTTQLTNVTVPVGYPVEETEVLLINEHGEEADVYGVGEMVFQSPYLALEYWNLPEQTKAAFGPHPLTGEGRVYYSGDLGRMLPDGSIEFMGRKDDQVKVRGYRIEVHEIESVFDEIEGIQKSAVIAVYQENGENLLVAYYVAKDGQEFSGEMLREQLKAQLPEYMIPSAFIRLETMPLTATGKLDRKALHGIKGKFDTELEYVAPTTEAERKMAALWSAVLGVEQVGVTDHFFDLGGHSLKAISLIAKVSKEFGVEFPLPEVFQRPTIREMLHFIEKAAQQTYTAIPVVAEREYYPVSSAQKRMYILHQLEENRVNYNLSGVIPLEGQVDLERLTRVFQTLIQRHESLRTSFAIVKGEPVQRIQHELPFALEHYEGVEDQVLEIVRRFVRPFDLRQAPLFRAGVLQAGNRSFLMYDMHHIISDGTSTRILAHEVIQLYSGQELEPLPIQYKDFAVWQNEFLTTAEMEKQEIFWLGQFCDEIPVLNLPTDEPRPAVMSFEGSRLYFTIDQELSDRLQKMTQTLGATLYMSLLSAYTILLSRYAGTEDLIVGSPVQGRRHTDVENVIGMFVNTLAMRNRPEKARTFRQYLQDVKENALQAFEHQDYPFEMLVEKLDLRRDLGRNPLFDTMFVLQNTERAGIAGRRGRAALELEFNATQFDLTLNAYETGSGIGCMFEYSTKLFRRETVERMAGHLIQIIREVVQNPEILLQEIQLLTPEEKEQILAFNATETAFATDKTICDVMEEQFKANPDRPAVIFGDEEWTYHELNQRAERLAGMLLTRGLQREEIVGIMVERSLHMVTAILGVLKAGGAFLPLDPTHPLERRQYILADSHTRILLTQKHLAETGRFAGEIIELDRDDRKVWENTDQSTGNGETGALPVMPAPTDLAYVIYTSGSTGKPKGVMIEHRSLLNTISWSLGVNRTSPEDRCIQLSSFAFDGFLMGFLTTLASGAQLVICSRDELQNPLALKKLIREMGITIIDAVPSLYTALIDCLTAEEASSIRRVVLGGETIQAKAVLQTLEKNPKIQLVNEYGPSENTISTTRYEGMTPTTLNVIGRPNANTKVYIVDHANQLAPLGVAGELCIAGVGLARGYLHRPELTEEKFVSCPVAGGERVYRTGDLAKWRPDGNLEFVGRIDAQVKIRGYRIELGEIEAVLTQMPGIKEAVVLDSVDDAGERYIAAYVVGSAERSIAGLRQELIGVLPEYMIPRSFVQLEHLPLTPNGKVDRRALLDLKGDVSSDEPYIPPRTTTEITLAHLWSELLGVQQIGTHDNFFTLGGHSLKATSMVTKVYKEMQVAIPLRVIYQTPTLEAVASYIDSQKKATYAAIQPVEPREYYPLSSAQKRLFILGQLERNTTYHMPGVLVLEAGWDLTRLQTVFEQLIQRHGSLRTSFGMVHGEMVQRLHSNVDFAIVEREAAVEEIPALVGEFVRPFDLGRAPLLRVEVIHTPEQSLLLFDLHHMIADGISLGILIRDLRALYMGETLPPLPIQYVDFAVWQNQYLASEAMHREEMYWLERFAGDVPVLQFPTDHPRPVIMDYAGDRIEFTLDQEMTGPLHELAKSQGVSLYMILLAIFSITLAKYSGQEDVVVGSPIAGRLHADVQNLIGMFVNTLAMRNQPMGDKTFLQFLAEVRENSLQAYEYQSYPLEVLVEKLGAARDLSRNPLFDTLFTLQNWEDESMTTSQVTPYAMERKVAKFDVNLQGIETPQGLRFILEYRTSLFEQESMERLARHFVNVTREILHSPEKVLGEIQMLSEEEKARLLYEFNATDVEFPEEQTICHLIEEQVMRNPDSPAFLFQDTIRTYGEMNRRANRVARILREMGVRPDEVVGLMVERSPHLATGTLGILKAGGAFLPLDPTYPEERIQYLLQDSQVRVLLTQKHLAETLSFAGTILHMEDEVLYDDGDDALPLMMRPTDLAYVLYTSGSTGKPKGVMIEHRNVYNTIKSELIQQKISRHDRYLQLFSHAFDGFLLGFFTGLASGVQFVMCSGEDLRNPLALKTLISQHAVTLIDGVPSLYSALVDCLTPEEFATVRTVFLGGETVNAKTVIRSKEKNPQVVLVNEYGPTESSIIASTFDGLDIDSLHVIGRPIANTRLYILDRNDQLTPVGVAGELCIAGQGLARGYLNRPDLTDEKFVSCPTVGEDRVYRTGDLARWLPDGNIEFLGRIDSQVKVRGYRIELGEIETHLIQIPGVREAAVIDQLDEQGNKYLCAYLVSHADLSISTLREELAKDLPEYMIPLYFVTLERLPLTPNGKVDRRALPQLKGNIRSGVELVLPGTATEETLVTIWGEILGASEISIKDSFFALGGHSLKAIALVAKIYKACQVEVPLRVIYQNPTLEALAQFIDASEQREYQSIRPVEAREYYPLSSAQKRLFIIHQRENSITYNMPGVLTIQGGIDSGRLEEAVHKLIQRHAAFRTSFAIVDGEMMQKVHPNVAFSIDGIEVAEEALRATIREFVRPFDLGKAPLLRMQWVKTPRETILMYDLHHIIADGVSMEILISDLMALYAGAELAPLRIRYVDFAVWQNQYLVSAEMKQEEEYWLGRFHDELPVLAFPTDYARPGLMDYAGDQIQFTIGPELTQKLDQLATEAGASLYMVLLAAYNILLAKYSGQEDIIVGSPIAGRPHADLEQIIGMFVNTLAMRNQPEGAKTFHTFLQEVRENSLQAFEHQNYQFEMLVDKLHAARDRSRNPLFDTLFTLQTPGQAKESQSYFTSHEVDIHIAKFDLTLQGFTRPDGITFRLEYRTRLFAKATIERVAAHFTNVLQAIVLHPKARIAEIDMLSAAERNRLIRTFNQTAADYPRDTTISQLFAEQVEKTPDQLAVFNDETRLTYRELNQQVVKLAQRLRTKGVGTEQIVGIAADRSIQMIIGVLAIVQAGGAYLPLDFDYPEDRIRYMLEDAAVKILLTGTALNKSLLFTGEILNIGDELMDQEKVAPELELINKPEDLIYVIYTSGSTGQPKGVMIEHRNVHHLLANSSLLQHNETDRILQVGSLAFDASTYEIWGALLNGAALCLMPKEKLLRVDEFSSIVKRQGITSFLLTTALFNQFVDEDPAIFAGVKMLMVGGEAGSPKHFNVIQAREKELALYNMYGPTEATVFATAMRVECEYEGSVPIGRPVTNTQAYILDRYNRLVPVGVVGELCIGGGGVARGYWKRPELTAERFIPNPLIEGERIYRTGDLAKWRPDGTIEYIGRMDHQVKIRGFRIEMGEIEAQLVSHPKVDEAVVLVKVDLDGEKYLCAYLVMAEEVEPGELRRDLSEKLPEYMIPRFFIPLERMPLTANGKVDRRALPEPDPMMDMGMPYVAPINATEVALAGIWAEVLQLRRIGREDHFFELGGHSLKATQLASKIFKVFHVEFPLREIFQRGTLREQAEYIERAALSNFRAIEPVEEREYYPLSSAQKRLFILHQLNRATVHYNMPGVMVFDVELPIEDVERVFATMIQRHEAFRTSFTMINGVPMQQVHPTVNFAISEFTVKNEAEIEGVIQQWIRPFDLGQAPLLRVGMIRAVGRNLLLLDLHHIISDGTSMGVLMKELRLLWQGSELPPLKIQYKDFAVWQNQFFASEAFEELEEYWLAQFADEVPVLQLPTDHPRPAVMDFAGDRFHFTVPPELTASLKEMARARGATLYMTLLAVFQILLAKYTGQDDLIVGSPLAGRTHADLDGVIGMFVNTLPMRNQPSGQKSFGAFLGEVRDRALKNYQYQEYQLEMLIEKLDLQRDVSRNPLVEAIFTLQNVEWDLPLPTEQRVESYTPDLNVVKFDLALVGVEERDEITMTMEYRTQLFERGTIQQMAGHFLRIIEAISADPEVRIAEIPMLSATEKQQLLEDFNATCAEIPPMTLHQLVEEQVSKTPDALAIVVGERRLTYREWNEKANQLARVLFRNGVKPDDIVGLLMERSPEAFVGILGILKAGAAYLPMDPEYPESRIQYMLADSHVQVLVTETHLVQRVPFTGVTVPVDLMRLTGDDTNLESGVQPRNLAYVIYTSGSTGNPKGVLVEHRSAVNQITWFKQQYEVQNQNRLALLFSFTFDPSVEQMFSHVTAGATVYCLSKEMMSSPERFREYVNEQAITTIAFVPSALRELLATEERLPSVHLVVSGGEVLDEGLKDHLFRLGYEVGNHYGPTEATIVALADQCTDARVTLGKPIHNTQCYVLDPDQRLLPIGVVGELYIGGEGLARGYLNRAELTAERFVANPFVPGTRMYRTGDLVRWLPDGKMEFFGRSDHQVKIRGFRIELSEIENQLLQHPAIQKAVVIDREDEKQVKYLAAYIQADRELAIAELRQYLAGTLPEYMVPSYFVHVDPMPILPNGKINLRALPAVEAGRLSRTYRAPESELETRLALLWTEILGVERVGTEDHFFELGGHSLKATQLISRVFQEFEIQIALMTFFQNPTILGMAAEIERNHEPTWEIQDENLVLLRHGTDRRKHLFLVHGGDGEAESYWQLVAAVTPEFHCWGLRSDRLIDYAPVTLGAEAVARKYIEKIQLLQPSGPYYIAGWSIGGTIVYEMAKQWEAMQEEVRFCGMIDAIPPQKDLWEHVEEFTIQSERKLLSRFRVDRGLRRSLKKADSIRAVWPRVFAYFDELGLSFEEIRQHIPEHVLKAIPKAGQMDLRGFIYYQNMIRTLARLRAAYIPDGKIQTQIQFFKAAKTELPNLERWDLYTVTPMNLYQVSGDHYSVLTNPKHVHEFAQVFNHVLRERSKV